MQIIKKKVNGKLTLPCLLRRVNIMVSTNVQDDINDTKIYSTDWYSILNVL
jgi:hypothetical protein